MNRALFLAAPLLLLAACSAPAGPAEDVAASSAPEAAPWRDAPSLGAVGPAARELAAARCVVDPSLHDRVELVLVAVGAWERATSGQFRCAVEERTVAGPEEGAVTFRAARPGELRGDDIGHADWAAGRLRAGVVLDPSDHALAFLSTAVHELGHALGLSHYNGPEPSVMPHEYRDRWLGGTRPTDRDVRAVREAWGLRAPEVYAPGE